MGKKRNSGFSLVELSIVLIIIGLLIAGVTAGSQLIRQAQLQSVIRDVESYKNAFSTFEATYDQYPGDFNNAETYWTAALTSNGNNDGKIGVDTTLATPTTTAGETPLAWNHLSRSEITPGSYPDIAVTSVAALTINTNFPETKISNSGIYPIFCGASGGQTNSACTLALIGSATANTAAPNSIVNGNYFVFGPSAAHITIANDTSLTPAEAFSIDNKADDGLPGTGNIIALGAFSATTTNIAGATCASSTTTTTSYTLANDTEECSLLIRIN